MENNIIELINQGLSLEAIGEQIGKSKSTTQRLLVKMGYTYDKTMKKYINQNETVENNVNNENVLRGTINNVSNETIKKSTIQRTYTIDVDMEKALRIKAAVEDKEVSEVVREALKQFIEDKYYNF